MCAFWRRAALPWLILAVLAVTLQGVVAGAMRCEVARYDAGLATGAPAGDQADHASHDHHTDGASERDPSSGQQGHHAGVCVCADGCHLWITPGLRSRYLTTDTVRPVEAAGLPALDRPVPSAVVIPYFLPPSHAPPLNA